MNEKSKKSHSKYRKSPNDFAKTVIAFVVTAIIIIVGAIIAVNKPACNLVHKLEADMPIGIRDIEIDQSQNTLTPIDSESLAFGSHMFKKVINLLLPLRIKPLTIKLLIPL